MPQATEFRYQQADGTTTSVQIERGNRDHVYSVTIDGQSYTVRVDEVAPDSIRFSVEGRSRRAYVVTEGSRRLVVLDGIDGRVYALSPANETADSQGSRRKASAKAGDEGLIAAMPGQIVKVLVSDGESVTRGQPLVVLEAMKMELRVTSPHDGQVARVLCEPGQVVERGQVLLELSGA